VSSSRTSSSGSSPEHLPGRSAQRRNSKQLRIAALDHFPSDSIVSHTLHASETRSSFIAEVFSRVDSPGVPGGGDSRGIRTPPNPVPPASFCGESVDSPYPAKDLRRKSCRIQLQQATPMCPYMIDSGDPFVKDHVRIIETPASSYSRSLRSSRSCHELYRTSNLETSKIAASYSLPASPIRNGEGTARDPAQHQPKSGCGLRHYSGQRQPKPICQISSLFPLPPSDVTILLREPPPSSMRMDPQDNPQTLIKCSGLPSSSCDLTLSRNRCGSPFPLRASHTSIRRVLSGAQKDGSQGLTPGASQ
jgi:hypothetical protein